MNVGISQEEKDLISQIKQMGSENEDSDKLLAFCQKEKSLQTHMKKYM